MLESITYKRIDGSYVGVVNGLPYHITSGDPLYDQAQVLGVNASFEPTPTPQTIQEQRAGMICSPAQMRLTLLSLGMLDLVQQIANSDPQASIVWEYATQIYRNSPFIENLLNNGIQSFTDEQVDAIFMAAMELDI